MTIRVLSAVLLWTTSLWAASLWAAVLTAPPARADFGYIPLFPFRSAAEAAAAQEEWHTDPAATALRFARDFLGFTELDRTLATDVVGDEAWVDVGAALPDGRPRTVATVHLARFGADSDAPWEVVGTRDTILTLDQPAYGSSVTQAFRVGGTISGVDESLHVQVRQVGRPGTVGEFCCLPGGGQQTPWTVPVMATAAAPGPATVVVSTGGHVALVESFAVTGVILD